MRVWRTAGEKYVPERLRMVNRNSMVSVMVWRVIGYHGVGNLVILDENVNAENHVRTLSENLLDPVENIFGDRNHPFVFQHDNAPAHTTRRTVASLEQQDISTIQEPSQSLDLNIVEQAWDFMGSAIGRVIPNTRNGLIRTLHNIWLNITVPYFHNLYISPPRRIRAVVRGRGYPTKYWLKKYFRKMDNIWICLTFP